MSYRTKGWFEDLCKGCYQFWYCSQRCRELHQQRHEKHCEIFQKLLSKKRLNRDVLSVCKLLLEIQLNHLEEKAFNPTTEQNSFQRWKDRTECQWKEPVVSELTASDSIDSEKIESTQEDAVQVEQEATTATDPPVSSESIQNDTDTNDIERWKSSWEPFFEDVENLVSNRHRWDKEDTTDWIKIVQLVQTLLSMTGEESSELLNSDQLLEMISRIESNNFGLWTSANREACYGRAVFPLASFFNHSCAPNCRTVIHGTVFTAYAAEDIQSGEELCISYIETNLPRSSRREKLSSDYRFDCDCKRCDTEKEKQGKVTYSLSKNCSNKGKGKKKKLKEKPKPKSTLNDSSLNPHKPLF